MDVNLTTETLLQLLKEKIFKIIVACQVGREYEKRAAADQQNGYQGDNNTSSDHSYSLDDHARWVNCIISASASSYRITCMKSTKSVSWQGILNFSHSGLGDEETCQQTSDLGGRDILCGDV